MRPQENNNMTKEQVIKIVKDYERGAGFTEEKYIDTPGDANSVVPRKYVTRNGTTTQRPTSSILGEFFFDTTIGRPIWWNGTAWVRADGTVV